jgi:hypothetical protein
VLSIVASLGASAGCTGTASEATPKHVAEKPLGVDAGADASLAGDGAAADVGGQDAGQQDAGPAEADAPEEAPIGEEEPGDSTDGTTPMEDAVGDAPQSDAGPDAWDHTCWCKNWTGDKYPEHFFEHGCVDDHPCAAGRVCCAITCVSPEVCVNTTFGWLDCMHNGASNDCCWKAPPASVCVLAELCAPEGVLMAKQYDPSVNNFPMCSHPGQSK